MNGTEQKQHSTRLKELEKSQDDLTLVMRDGIQRLANQTQEALNKAAEFDVDLTSQLKFRGDCLQGAQNEIDTLKLDRDVDQARIANLEAWLVKISLLTFWQRLRLVLLGL